MKIYPGIVIAVTILMLCPALLADDLRAEKSESYYQSGAASRNQGMFQSPLYNQYGQDDYDGSSYPDYRSPSTAFVIALIPGFFVHGLGHIYAGDGLTGIILAGTEALSILAILGGALAGMSGENSYDDDDVNPSPFIAIGLVGYFGTWIYDMIGAPNAAEKHNDKIRNQVIFGIDECNTVKVSFSFSF